MAFHKTYNKKNVIEEYKKRFQEILEYTMPNSDILDEDGEELNQDELQTNDASQDLDNNIENAPENIEGEGVDNPIPNNMDDANMNNETDLTSNFNPQDNNMESVPETSAMQPEDEVIDITELTDAQEETLDDIKKFDNKFIKALKAIAVIQNKIEDNNSKIENLESEIKKRNPTPIEKMSNRASISYPFNISPEDYWKEKEKNSNYSTDYDNNGKEQEQYTITVNDINSANDWKNISDSLNDDFLYKQTLNKILNM